jgi:FtsP/CotA-like multicopper oxidase with cupredoxin domain
MRRFTLAVCSLTIAAGACHADPDPIEPDIQEPITEPPVEPPVTEPAIPPEPEWKAPDILGQVPFVDLNPDPNVVEVNLEAAPYRVRLEEGLEIEMYGYNGSFPGPILQAKVGDEVIVHFSNNLPEATTVHWHGLRIPADMDGSPLIQNPVQPGERFDYRFVVKDAGTFWYHPHVRAHEQVEKGLYGTIIVHDKDEPEFDAERYIVLDDIYLSGSNLAPFMVSHMELMHGRSGNLLLTNGTAEDIVVEQDQGAVERWRLVNTANARTMSVSIEGAEWRVVGTDGGRLHTPFQTGRLTIPVGQRYDLEVHLVSAGQVVLSSHVPVLDEAGNVVEGAIPVYSVAVAEREWTQREIVWPELPARTERPSTLSAQMLFNARSGGEYGIEWTINGLAHSHEPLFTWEEGATVEIELVNQAGPEHPFHLHGQFFEIVGDAEPGLKDTVLLRGGSTMRIVTYLDNPGRWMAHCHILEHAELGMMTEIMVTPKTVD